MSLRPLHESYETTTFWWQTAGFSSGKEGGTYCYQCASRGRYFKYEGESNENLKY